MSGHHGMVSSSNGSAYSGMDMIFYTSTTTPIFSSQWTPTSTAQYAGTCLFLITLAIIFRALFALGYKLDKRNIDAARKRRYIVVAGQTSITEETALNSEAKSAVLISERGGEEEVRVVSRKMRTVMPWRLSTDLPRALLSTVTIGVGYLLMLAVMTMNVGYFCSVLTGIFVGELAFGRYTRGDEH